MYSEVIVITSENYALNRTSNNISHIFYCDLKINLEWLPAPSMVALVITSEKNWTVLTWCWVVTVSIANIRWTNTQEDQVS